MKVLHLIQSNRFSGAENMVCQIVAMMADNPDIEMAYCSKDGQIRDALEERNIKFFPLKKLSASEVKKVIKEYRPDIIHTHDMAASFTGALACGRIPLIAHIHGNHLNSRKISPKSVAFLWTALKAKHIFWVSKSALAQYKFSAFVKSKSSVLYNIIDIESLYKKMELDTNTYNYDIAYVGRLTFPKNPERLVNVIAKAVEKKPDLKVAVIGTGDLEGNAKRLAQQMGLNSNIDFLGFQSNPLKALHSAKVMIMTSRYEGTPMCALESLALGTPIVSTPTDGLCELIENGVNGYLSDDDDELAQRLFEIVQNSTLEENLSNNAKNMAFEQNRTDLYKEKLLKQYKINP